MRLAIAESCTGGWISHLVTNVPGSSDYLDSAVVCYSNASKTDLLGVPGALLRQRGAVSAETAVAMAEGVRGRRSTDIGLAVTGIAGPGGGSPEKPVGLVFFGLASSERAIARRRRFGGGRLAIKRQAADVALELVIREVRRSKAIRWSSRRRAI